MQRTLKTVAFTVLFLASTPCFAANYNFAAEIGTKIARDHFIEGCDPAAKELIIGVYNFNSTAYFPIHEGGSFAAEVEKTNEHIILKLVKLDGCTATFWGH